MPDTRELAREFPRLAEGLEFSAEETAGGTVIAFLPPDRFLEVSSQTARILRLVNGERDVRTLAELASAELSMDVSPGEFHALVDQSLVPRGLVRYGGPATATARSDGARRVQVIPERTVAAMARPLAFLYRRPVAFIGVVTCLGAQAWFFLSGRGTTATPAPSLLVDWLAAIALYLVSTLAHELGHAAAIARFGVSPGAIGLAATRGVPHWIAGVKGIWKLRRSQRIVVDIGGTCLQALFVGLVILVQAILPAHIPWIVVARAVVIVDVAMLFNLAPLWRSDGFWLATDLAGSRHARAEPAATAGRDPMRAILPARVPGAYGPLYSLIASACLVGLLIWMSAQPGFETGLAAARGLDLGTLVAITLSLGLKALVVVGLALAVWTGLAWCAAAMRAPQPPDSHSRVGGAS